MDEGTTDTQLYSIIQNIKTSKFKDYPVFITGTINSLSESARWLIDNNIVNLNDLDKRNENLNKTTFHSHGEMNDNQQRDFILLKDIKGIFKLNYFYKKECFFAIKLVGKGF